jgi:hypothetical protein
MLSAFLVKTVLQNFFGKKRLAVDMDQETNTDQVKNFCNHDSSLPNHLLSTQGRLEECLIVRRRVLSSNCLLGVPSDS